MGRQAHSGGVLVHSQLIQLHAPSSLVLAWESIN